MSGRIGVTKCFYVYVHSRLRTGEPFYVGKGYGGRVNTAKNRNIDWKTIVLLDGGFHSSFVALDLDEEFALLLEIEMIDKYRKAGVILANKTGGGQGTSGCASWNKGLSGLFKHSTESKLKMSQQRAGRKVPDDVLAKRMGRKWSQETIAKHIGRKRSPEAKANISAGMIGKKYPHRKAPSLETRAKISLANTGKQFSSEHKAKLSLAKMGNTSSVGRKHSAEFKKILSLAAIAVWAKRKNKNGHS